MIKRRQGFTLIELLVVIAIIGVLSSVVLVSLDQARTRARRTAALSELNQIYTAIEAARFSTGKVLGGKEGITGSYCSRCSCAGDIRHNTGACFERSLKTLENINEKSGGLLENFVNDPENIRDPWGSPYTMDENEGEYGPTDCRVDYLLSFGPNGKLESSSSGAGGDDVYIKIKQSIPACQ